VLQRDYPDQVCSIARSLEVIGERWTLLILRDALIGLTRFEEFQAKLGIASNVLTNRLKRLCDEDTDLGLEYTLARMLKGSPSP